MAGPAVLVRLTSVLAMAVLLGATLPASEAQGPIGECFVNRSAESYLAGPVRGPPHPCEGAKMANATVAQSDMDRDGLGDDWEAEWSRRIGQAIEPLADLDGDGLLNVDEFRWQLIPACVPPVIFQCQDTDTDGWNDREETEYWDDVRNNFPVQATMGAAGLVALFDPDRTIDTDGDLAPNVRDPDSDEDGLRDGDEALVYGSYPEFPDSDCRTAASCPRSSTTNFHRPKLGPGAGDGLPDGSEVAAWLAVSDSAWSTDHDGDGIFGNLLDADADGDGLLDGEEFLLGQAQVRPDIADTDSDEALDGDEAAWSADTDRDGLLNANDPDSDADGMPDGWEAAHGLGMVDPTDAALDKDGDALANLPEFQHGTDPTDPDTEGDELRDGPEVAAGADPFHWDTDRDTLPDAWEQRFAGAADPTVPDATLDADSDSFGAAWCGNAGGAFHNRAEYLHAVPAGWDSRPVREGGDGVWWDGGHPDAVDSDGDGLHDGYEVCSGTDPRSVDLVGADDADEDGLSNLQEMGNGTRHDVADTDGDGLCDGGRAPGCVGDGPAAPGEARDYRSDPLAADTDGEGWVDGPEARHWDPAATGRDADTDADGTTNLWERDSDGDGLDDFTEANPPSGADPSDPGTQDGDRDGLTDAEERQGWTAWAAGVATSVRSDPRVADTDGDGLGDLEERSRETHPRRVDTDLDGANDKVEADGWTIVVDGIARRVQSDPRLPDSDADGLADGLESTLGSDPGMADTDGDAWPDLREDEDRDGLAEEGEASATSSDTDRDGLPDGREWSGTEWTTDPLAADTDEDGLLDGFESGGHGTNPNDPDSDDDLLLDGEESGLAEAGGQPGRVTDPHHADSDRDAMGDGEEVLFAKTDPTRRDTDCDGSQDGLDKDPLTSNVPPGQARPPEERLCPTAPGASRAMALPALPPSLPWAAFTSSAADASEIGLLVVDADGTVTILARAPASESPIVVVQSLLQLDGVARTSADGNVTNATAHLTAELQSIDEAGVEEEGNPYTHSVRVALPEGMVSAHHATFSLTFVDANRNSATYTGEASGFDLREVQYADDLNAVDEQDWNDDTNATQDASGWDYIRANMTGGPSDEEPTAPLTASPEDDELWLYRIVQPSAPSHVVEVIDGVYTVLPANGTLAKAVIFADALVPVDPGDVQQYTGSRWWKPVAESFKKVAQATSKAWTATKQVVSTIPMVFNVVGEQVKSTTMGIYDDLRNPRSPAAHAARFAADIVGIGDVVDIVEGVRKGDWAQVGLAAACLALTVIPMAKAPVAAAKASFRAAKAAGASDELVSFMGRAVDSWSWEGMGGAAKIRRLNDVVQTAAGRGPTELGSLEILARAGGREALGTNELRQSTLEISLVGKQVAAKGPEGAERFIERAGRNPDGDGLGLERIAKVDAALSVRSTEATAQVLDDALALRERRVVGIGRFTEELISSSPSMAKGRAYELRVAARDAQVFEVGAKHQVSFLDPTTGLSITRTLDVDVVKRLTDSRMVIIEAKDTTYLSLDCRTKKQILKMEAFGMDSNGDVADALLQVRNGVVSEPLKRFAGIHGVKIVDDAGSVLNAEYWRPWS